MPKNETVKWLFCSFLCYAMSLLSIMLNTFLEYFLDVYPDERFYSWVYYFHYNLQYSIFGEALIALGSGFIGFFYYEIFMDKKSRFLRGRRNAYWISALFLAGIDLICLYITQYLEWSGIAVPGFFSFFHNSDNRAIVIGVHTGTIFLPLLINTITLRGKLVKEDPVGNKEMINKFSYIIFMVLSFAGFFVCTIVSSFAPMEFPVWFYLRFICVSLSALTMYYGFVKEIEKE
ncbi:MAG: hypothetical protein ACFFCS_22190 [Candidatus Hodarchaeota archaeon]